MEEDLCFHPKEEGQDDDIEAGSERDTETLRTVTSCNTNFTTELSSGCSICLEPFGAGDAVMHSKDVQECRHVFHQECIVSWLATQSTSVCPCCRQEFLGVETPGNSLGSHGQFQNAMGGIPAMESPATSAIPSLRIDEVDAVALLQDDSSNQRDGNDDDGIAICI